MDVITIDCTPVQTPEQLHVLLAEALEFPEYYGANLDALYDCLTDDFRDRELVLTNWHSLEYRLKDYSGKLLYVFHCACNDNRHLTVTLHP